MEPSEWTRALSPPEIVRLSARLPEGAFARIFGLAPLLAIGVPPGDLPLAAGLELALGNVVGPSPPGVGRLEFHTMAAERIEPSPPSGEPALLVDTQTLIQRLASAARHLIRLEKRANANSAYADRISVGRALSGDIILRHRSISKFHAYFQRRESGIWSIVDAGSTNGTTVNGDVVIPRQQHPLAIGDQIAFGSLDAIFLDAFTLWRVLHTTRS